MRLSFDDEESFKEVVGSLRFDNPPSDSNSAALHEVGTGNTSDSAALEEE
jgi:hypothetical protein